ncbi:MAG: hypothetical protein IJE89_00500 [Bacilli bacterium]|nr:hypothetical protein [Bacilli bacterium]
MLYTVKKDKEYKKIVKDIFRNVEFKKIYNIEHHGISRMEHSIKISYYSYRIAKKLKMDYVSVARGGLLHDFFLDGDERNTKRKFLDTFTHPKKALNTSMNNFDINDLEKDIIVSHMFPIYLAIPKYKESVLVNLVDKVVGFKELVRGFGCKFNYRFKYTYVFMLLLMTR